MPTFQKELIGLVSISGPGDYQMVLPKQINTPMANALATIHTEEVYINCDSSAGPINIILPQISLFNGNFQTKIYVNDVTFLPTTVTVYSYSGSEIVPGDYINGAVSNQVVGGYGTNYYHIVSEHNWMCLIAEGIVAPPVL